MSLRKHTGFTLIELLIVVAIIGILAAIAIPNFMLAQIRAKVARAKGDHQSIATALELYRVDGAAYPTMWESGFNNGLGYIPPELRWWYVPNALSTPVAYITSASIYCPFDGNWDKKTNYPGIWMRYGYENIQEMVAIDKGVWPILNRRFGPEAIDWSGPWRLQCIGPDKLWNPSVNYDPTNGTMSGGDIIRTQKSPSGNIPNRLS